jgi:hypothetical protein
LEFSSLAKISRPLQDTEARGTNITWAKFRILEIRTLPATAIFYQTMHVICILKEAKAAPY